MGLCFAPKSGVTGLKVTAKSDTPSFISHPLVVALSLNSSLGTPLQILRLS